MKQKKIIISCLLSSLILPAVVQAQQWSGYMAAEARYFSHDPLLPVQHGNNLSVSAQTEYYKDWDDGAQGFAFVPFVRIDQHDDERTHVDIRELTWLKAAEDWELRLGIRKLFWGVTESQHLVDIINQTDAVENIDGEEKLGQPMINLALIRDWGTLDLFVLPGFRERTFPGKEGRLRTLYYVNTDEAGYESSREEKHVDYAMRWFNYIGDWDLGLSYFRGTSRDPAFRETGVDSDGDLYLKPYYEIMTQFGLDVQAVKGDWLWKLEAISRDVDAGRYTALTGGFEYTFVGIADTAVDLGIVSEYLFDNRDEQATTPFANDMLLATRLTFNDVQSTDLLAGIIFDLDHSSYMFNLEGSRRIGASYKLSVEARAFANQEPTELQYDFRNDDYLQAELAWYF